MIALETWIVKISSVCFTVERGDLVQLSDIDIEDASTADSETDASGKDEMVGEASEEEKLLAKRKRRRRRHERKKTEVLIAKQKAKIVTIERNLKNGGRARKSTRSSSKDTPEEHVREAARHAYKLDILERRQKRLNILSRSFKEAKSQIHGAAADGDADYVKFIVDNGVPVDIRDKMGVTPLIHATTNNKVSVAQVLVDCRADVGVQDENGATCLHYAVQVNNLHLLRVLVDAETVGSKIDILTIKDMCGKTPIDYARRRDRSGCLELMAHRIGGRPRLGLASWWVSDRYWGLCCVEMLKANCTCCAGKQDIHLDKPNGSEDEGPAPEPDRRPTASDIGGLPGGSEGTM